MTFSGQVNLFKYEDSMKKHLYLFMTINFNQYSVSDSSVENGIFFADFLYFLLMVNQYTFFGISCTFTKVTEHKHEVSGDKNIEENMLYKQNALCSVANFLFPLFVWFVTKYHYWFTTNFLLLAITAISSQITYFANVMRPGKILFLMCCQKS